MASSGAPNQAEARRRVYAYVLGPRDGRALPCYDKLETAVRGKNPNFIKKASDKCGENKRGPKIAAVAAETGVGEAEVREILLGLRAEIKDGYTREQLLETATAAAQEGGGDGTDSSAPAADQATASLDPSHCGEDATEGAAGGQCAGAGESVSPTTTTAGRAGVGTDGDRAAMVPAAVAGGASIGGEQLDAASPPRLLGPAVYEGEKDAEGRWHGQGTLQRDGAKYEGAWMHGEQHGQGTQTTSDGSTYEGAWVNGKQHGQGTQTTRGAFTYTGEFVDGKPHGQGELTRTAGGKKWSGKFVSGDIVEGTHFCKKHLYTYTGKFQGRKPHGQGVKKMHGDPSTTHTKQLEGKWRNGFAVGVMHRTLQSGNTIKIRYYVDGKDGHEKSKRHPFDPFLQDHNDKAAWYAGLPGQELGKLTALPDGQYTFACHCPWRHSSQRTAILQEYEASEAVEAQKERDAGPSVPRIVDAASEESTTGPARRERSDVADAAADDEPALDGTDNREDVQPPKQKRKSMQTKAATKAVPRKKKKSDPYSHEELIDQLDHLENKGPAFTLTHASNSDVPGATAGKVIDSVEYEEVMGMSSFPADKKRKWAARVNKKAKAGYLPVHGHKKSTGGLRRCMHDMAINGAKRLGVTIDGKQFMKECKPRRTVDTSFEEIENAPSVASKVTFTHVNVSHQKGGNEAALLSIEDGGVYAVVAQVDGHTAEYHAFVYDSTGILPGPYKAHSGIVIDNGKKRPVFLIDKEDRSSVQKKRDVLNDLFGARTYVMHVYRMRAVEGG